MSSNDIMSLATPKVPLSDALYIHIFSTNDYKPSRDKCKIFHLFI